jgi:exodeoxyribonuclease V alpha subunit
VRIRFDERELTVPLEHLSECQLSYAISIHKSQGSEYPAVIIPVHTQHTVMLQRNLLYTAITRARRLVVLVGSKKALWITLHNTRQKERHSRLRERIIEAESKSL